MGWSAQDIPNQAGRVAVVTGANSGLGLEAARALARAGAHVILACRSEEKGRAAVADIESESPAGRAELSLVDLSSLDSVRSFAESTKTAHEHIHLLINNAGVMATPFSHTADGFELQFGTNHLGHFALTGRLIDRIANTEGARIVSVSSLVHRAAKIDFSNLNGERGYQKWKAYAASKLANLLFSTELAGRLSRAGAKAIAVAAHPGYTSSNLQRDNMLLRFVAPATGMSPVRGSIPILYAATAPGVRNDDYYGPGGIGEVFGASPKKAKRSGRARNLNVAAQLWEASERLTGVSFEL